MIFYFYFFKQKLESRKTLQGKFDILTDCHLKFTSYCSISFIYLQDVLKMIETQPEKKEKNNN